MSIRITENTTARRLQAYDLQEVLSHEAAGAAFAAISACPLYARTPLRRLDRVAASSRVANVWYKDEADRFGLGSFKALGGAYAVARLLQHKLAQRLGRDLGLPELVQGNLRQQTQQITVTCATDGNHGRSVAAGARIFGCRCVIFLHAEVSQGREDAIRAYGADIERIAGNYDESVLAASRAAERNGWDVVSDTSWPGYESVPRDVMQGYTVMLIETLQQLQEHGASRPTHVFVQGGVGGLAAAVCAHLWEAMGTAAPITTVVEPERADCLFQSALAGQPTPASGDLSTVMAGLSCGEVSSEAWRVLSRGARFFLTIDDAMAIEAMRLLAQCGASEQPIIAGESATAGLAALIATAADPALRRQIELTPDSSVLLIGSEGATDPELYRKLVGQAA
ncbi:MAG TPA: diaminopropionate ammonia-lyase [Acetobacteraceae bacterium]